jgi:pilus assembly protein CpaB
MVPARGLLILGLAALLAVASVFLARSWLLEAARENQASQTLDRSGPDTMPVVVAARPLRYGDKLTAADFKLLDWPRASVPAGSFQDLTWLEPEPGASQGSQRVLLRTLQANEPVMSSMISGLGANSRLAATIAPGKRAATINTSGISNLAEMIGPGDRVDVLIARQVQGPEGGRELRSDVLLSDLRVLGFEDAVPGAGGRAAHARSVTLEVTVEQAQTLAIGEKIGSLTLALRGLDPSAEAGRQPVFSSELLGGQAAGALRQIDWRNEKPATPVRVEAPASPGSVGPGTTVRVFRGLESIQYEVALEAKASAVATIDAAKRAGAKAVAPQ